MFLSKKRNQEIHQTKRKETRGIATKRKEAETSQCRSFTQNSNKCDICYTREAKKKIGLLRKRKIRILMKRIIHSEEHLTFSFCRET